MINGPKHHAICRLFRSFGLSTIGQTLSDQLRLWDFDRFIGLLSLKATLLKQRMRVERRHRRYVLLLNLTLVAIGCRDTQRERQVQQFYPDGQVKVVATLRGNQMHGRCLRYYRNGALHTVERYQLGVPTGTAVLFDSLGKRLEQRTYDPSGKEIYNLYFDQQGKPWSGSLLPITEAKDTIVWGEKYTGSIRFGYPLKGKMTMIVGVLGEDLKAYDRWPMVDTFQVVPQSKDGRFHFSYYPKRLEKNALHYKFIQPERHGVAEIDSGTVDMKSVKHSFLVMPPSH